MPAPLLIGGLQAGAGAIQSIFGGGRARRAERELEGMINNYKGSESIKDFYTKALNKYNVNPTQSALYRNAMNQAQQGLASGLNNLQGRGGALAGTANLVQGYNDAALRAGAAAEQQQSQDLAALGGATQMKDREDKYKFEAKANLLSQKAGAGAQTMNAGLGNIFGGLGSISDYYTMKELYGGNGTGGGDNYQAPYQPRMTGGTGARLNVPNVGYQTPRF